MCLCLLQAFLENEDLGNSLGSVEALLEKHDDFEEAFTAQEEKITVRCGLWSGHLLCVCLCHFIQHPSLERTTCHFQTQHEGSFQRRKYSEK